MRTSYFLLFFSFAILASASFPERVLQILRVLDAECNNHGYFFKSKCFCEAQYSGQKCETKSGHKSYDNPNDKCDDLSYRLDNLLNISPNFYSNDDDEFPRLSGNSIGEGNAAYGDKGSTWIRMSDISGGKITVFKNIDATDVKQGALGNCYLLAAFASLSKVRNGEIIKNAFVTQTDNDKHVFVTRWLIDGKPRFVAVDDWIPGNGKSPAFSRVSEDGEFWAIILEKAWGKIHGTYMRTEGGWHTNVWKSLSQAPIYQVWHKQKGFTADSVFDFVKNLLNQQFAVGAATVEVDNTKEVGGHAYSILEALEVTLDNGLKQKLFRMYNPWNSDYWADNPWGDNSKNWTPKVIAQVNYVNKNDGQFYTSTSDYLLNFGTTNWAEAQQDYDIAYQDISLTSAALKQQSNYETKFRVSNNRNRVLYVMIDTSDDRLQMECGASWTLNNLKVVSPSGKAFNQQSSWATDDGLTIRIDNAEDGEYTVTANVVRAQNYALYFTVTTYSARDTIQFVPRANNDVVIRNPVNCPNDCSGQGRCNTFQGECHCYYPYAGATCSGKTEKQCPANCNGNGVCDTVLGTCTCNSGFKFPDCKPCTDISNDCSYFAQAGYCATNAQYYQFMKGSCQLTCANAGFKEGFEECVKNTVSKCQGKTCSGNGKCNENNGACVCNSGFTGQNCESNIQPSKCQGRTCSGNGKCNENDGICYCNSGFNGQNCENKIQPTPTKCQGKTCSGNGQCQENNGLCLCNYGFTGVDCDKKIQPNPTPTCVDKDLSGNCSVWANAGYCSNSWASNMQYWCAKTCKFCI